ncbi:hypothetical protein HB364_21105 [Pseudoflavitalea sp. X16]|uniref:hypothetical protein n=1 Tax=Paraflavitalea devenefica TaxID=2716334 RepID=UPI00142459DE|nr:hypothetical protein [Paraflavitalea devenefica]NII27595.1 hypothetical protein [Paraflavitalea devenefica]
MEGRNKLSVLRSRGVQGKMKKWTVRLFAISVQAGLKPVEQKGNLVPQKRSCCPLVFPPGLSPKKKLDIYKGGKGFVLVCPYLNQTIDS